MSRVIARLGALIVLLVSASAASAQVVALGASNTAGFGVGAGNAYPAQLERILRARGVNVSVRNSGVSGNTTSDMLERLDNAVPAGTKVVLFHAGGNDFRRGVSESQRSSNIAAINKRLAARGIRVIDVSGAFLAARPGNLLSDGIHLTVEGHKKFAAGVVEQVVSALK